MLSVEANKVSKSYGGKKVLSDVNFKVDAGEIFSVIGPSGSGKSTLLRILNLLEHPDNGNIIFADSTSQLQDDETIRRRMTLLLQRPVMLKDTVFGNIAYGLKLRGLSDAQIKSRVKVALEDVGLKDFEKRRAFTLSGGEMQRVAFARAVALEPEILLLDEFTANLDPPNVKMLESALMSYISRSGCTTILVSHNPFQAKRLAKRCMFLYEGKVLGINDMEHVQAIPDERIKAFFRGDLI